MMPGVPDAPPVIRCHGLVKRYQDVVALAGLDLEVRAGECFGLLGPNGAGKTTTVEVLQGIITPDAGSVSVLGRTWARDADSLRACIGGALQETQLADKLTVEETLTLFASFYPKPRDVGALIAELSLEEKRRAWIGKLSGGQRQRVALACALVGDPMLLFLDEPTTGLDPHSRREVWERVAALQRDGRTVLLTTHYMEEAERLCDRVAIIDHGRIIALGSPAELIASLGGEEVVELTGSAPLDAEALRGVDGVRSVRIAEGAPDTAVLGVSGLHHALPSLMAQLAQRGVALSRLATHRATLEDVFVSLTGRRLDG
jgi:ABC-2 type transport system ATP-binding protein